MKSFIYFLLTISLLSAKEINLDLTITDQSGKNLNGAECTIQFNQTDSKKFEVLKGTSDKMGNFSTRLNTYENLYVEVNKVGYYKSRLYDISSQQDLKLNIKLIEKINPIGLYVKHYTGNPTEGLKFPKYDEWIGYDLKIGDWIKPYGVGIVCDFKMKFHCDEQSLANTYLELETEDEEAGFFIAHEIINYSELKLPHLAPNTGYIKKLIISGADWENYRGIFLRCRVLYDKENKVISANYAKIQGPILLNRKGSIGFTYYLNNTVNDRNLEFSLGQNLFKADNDYSSPQFEP